MENMVHVHFMPSFWLMLWQLPLMLEVPLLSCKQLINNKNKTLKILLYVTYTKFWSHLMIFYDCFTCVSNMIICLHLVSCLMLLLFHLPLLVTLFSLVRRSRDVMRHLLCVTRIRQYSNTVKCYEIKLVCRVMGREKVEKAVCVQHALHCSEILLASRVKKVQV